MITITSKDFQYATGQKPVEDDLERANCLKAGDVGHRHCGWCYDCNAPVTICKCPYLKPERTPFSNQFNFQHPNKIKT